MATALSESLLARLSGGDAAAGEQAFRAFEPYLRRLVRRRLAPRMRAKFDSVDVVQSVWVDLVRGFQAGSWQFADAARLRAFLVRATRNRFLNRVDRHRAAVDRERPLPPDGADPRLPSREPPPSERARRDELWERLLALCPPARRRVLGPHPLFGRQPGRRGPADLRRGVPPGRGRPADQPDGHRPPVPPVGP